MGKQETMMTDRGAFWKQKPLGKMTREEWESLCDGCAGCCLEKIEDGETGEILATSISCEFLDIVSCRCLIYEDRNEINPSCLKLTMEKLEEINWLPPTCAYRMIMEKRDLQWWHPLVSGDPKTVHEAGISVRDRVLSGAFVHPHDIS